MASATFHDHRQSVPLNETVAKLFLDAQESPLASGVKHWHEDMCNGFDGEGGYGKIEGSLAQ